MTFSLFHCIIKKDYHSLPPGKELNVRLSIVRPLKIESSDVIFCDFRSNNIWNNGLAYGILPVIHF